VRRFEFAIALVFAAAGVRSIVHHARRPLGSTDTRDQLLYAVYLTGRVGVWFAFAGLFLIFAFAGATDPAPDPVTGRLAVDDASHYTWYVMVFVVLGAMQLLASWFLGHRGDGDGDDGGASRRP
jgi:hypothetical protein